MNLDKIEKIIKGWAIERPLIKKAYGSRVKGNYRPDSDLDIAVECDLNAATANNSDSFLLFFENLDNGNLWSKELEERIGLHVHLEFYDHIVLPRTIEKGLKDASRLVYEKNVTT